MKYDIAVYLTAAKALEEKLKTYQETLTTWSTNIDKKIVAGIDVDSSLDDKIITSAQELGKITEPLNSLKQTIYAQTEYLITDLKEDNTADIEKLAEGLKHFGLTLESYKDPIELRKEILLFTRDFYARASEQYRKLEETELEYETKAGEHIKDTKLFPTSYAPEITEAQKTEESNIMQYIR